MSTPTYNDSVFINCPFDDDYKPILRAIVYAIYRCGFYPQTALDEDDGTEIRLLKIIRKMKSCRYGIHDLSRIELNAANFPRFNMPFELGLAVAWEKSNPTKHNWFVFEAKAYLVQRSLSDLNGRAVQSIDVPVKRLDDLHLDQVGLIKIDVEGHELAVLRGAADTLTRNRPAVLAEAEERHHPHAPLDHLLIDERLAPRRSTSKLKPISISCKEPIS